MENPQEIAVTFYPRFSRRLPMLYTRRLFDRKFGKKHRVCLMIHDRHADAEAKPYLEHEFNATSTGILKTRPRRILHHGAPCVVGLCFLLASPQEEEKIVSPPLPARVDTSR
ncbi:MAG: hypothetical protein R2911_29255 [Caldilineaceae bacterium]